MQIEVWTDGTTGGFNISVDGQVTYFPSYDAALAELKRRGVSPQEAAARLDNARRKAKEKKP